jgi:hypothetical protein
MYGALTTGRPKHLRNIFLFGRTANICKNICHNARAKTAINLSVRFAIADPSQAIRLNRSGTIAAGHSKSAAPVPSAG